MPIERPPRFLAEVRGCKRYELWVCRGHLELPLSASYWRRHAGVLVQDGYFLPFYREVEEEEWYCLE
jgi:hypothetical protein